MYHVMTALLMVSKVALDVKGEMQLFKKRLLVYE